MRLFLNQSKLFLMLYMYIPALGINTMLADVLAPKFARASTGTVMAVQNRQHILCVPELIISTGVKQNPIYDSKR